MTEVLIYGNTLFDLTQILREFAQYVEDANENAFLELIKDRK